MKNNDLLQKITEVNSEIKGLFKIYNSNPDSNANHLLRNLQTSMNIFQELTNANSNFFDKELESIAESSVKFAKKYMDLLKNNLAYAQVELYGQKTKEIYAFQDIGLLTEEQARNLGFSAPSFAYIGLSERRLRR